MAGFGFDDSPGFGFHAGLGSPHLSSRPPRPEYRQPLPPEQAEPYTKSLTNHGLSGLQYVLSSLDKPGRAVRGVLAGRNDEALAAIPFSDSLGITDPNRAVTGRDLLNRSGITDKHDKGWGSWGLGLGAELALDPLTYVGGVGTLKALTPLGKATAKAGRLAGMTRSERVVGGHSGLLNVGLPFGPQATLGTGKVGQAVADGIDRLADKAQFGNPIGRGIGSLFNHKLQGTTGADTQRAMSKYHAPALDRLQAEARGQHGGLVSQLNTAKATGVPERDLLTSVVEHAEGVPATSNPVTAQAASPIGQFVREVQDTKLADEQRLGGPLTSLADEYASHVPREAASVSVVGAQLKGDTAFQAASRANIRRKDLFRNVPGGQSFIDRMSGLHAGTDPNALAPILAQEMHATLTTMGRQLNPMQLKDLDDKAADLASKIGGLDPTTHLTTVHGPMKQGLTVPGLGGYYNPDLTQVMAKDSAGHVRKMAAMETGHGMIADAARGIGTEPGLVPVSRAIRSVGANPRRNKGGLVTRLADPNTGTPITGAMAEQARQLHARGLIPDPTPYMHGKLGPLRRLIDQAGVSPDVLAQLQQVYPKLTASADVAGPIKGLDTATSWFKNLTYPIWFPSHVRNFMTGKNNNALEGVGLPFGGDGSLAYKVLRDTATAADVAKANWPGMPAGMTDQQAREWIKIQAFKHGNVGGGLQGGTDMQSVVAKVAGGKDIIPPTPLSGRAGTGGLVHDSAQLLKEGLLGRPETPTQFATSPKWINKQAGVGYEVLADGTKVPRTKDEWSVLNAGRTIGRNTEDYLRLESMLGHVRQGYSPAVAGARTNRVHFDYDKLAPFEKKVMKRVVPFYTYARKNLPLQLDRLAGDPRSVVNQLRPLGRNDPGQYTPDHIASGVAIPTGPEVGGNQQFVSQLGLPLEEAFERMKLKGGLPDLKGTALSYMGSMNPLIKAPLEQLFDTQFHTGRKLSDLRAPAAASALGHAFGDDNPQLLGQLISNSPLTRFATSADKLMDPRKSISQKILNLGTGVRVTDVDMNKARAVESRRALEEMLKGSPNVNSYTNFYVKPENVGQLSPQETEQMRMLGLLQQNARAYAEQQRQQGGR